MHLSGMPLSAMAGWLFGEARKRGPMTALQKASDLELCSEPLSGF